MQRCDGPVLFLVLARNCSLFVGQCLLWSDACGLLLTRPVLISIIAEKRINDLNELGSADENELTQIKSDSIYFHFALFVIGIVLSFLVKFFHSVGTERRDTSRVL